MKGLAQAQRAGAGSGARGRAFDHLKHIVYIVKENRTYDQVLGDLGKGNGDPSFAIDGQGGDAKSWHKLAREYVTLDNCFTPPEATVRTGISG